MGLACVPALLLSTMTPAETPQQPPPALRLAVEQPLPGPGLGEPSEPSPTPAPSPEPPPVRTVTLAVTGDVLVHDNVWASAARAAGGRGFDFRPMLASLRPTLSSVDLALCHLETPLAPAGGPYSDYPLFAAPPAVVPALAWVGYDGCSTASNHSVDQGFAGLTRTLDVLDAAGLAHTGTARTAAESRTPVLLDEHGIRIAWLSYSYGTNGMPVDAGRPWSVHLIDVPRILSDAHRARARGADAVVVALHWGDEYAHTPSAYQVDVAERLTRSEDVTLIYGHHAHVTQPIRKVNGTWVIYGLGNLLAGQGTTAPGVDHGLVGLVTLRQRGDGPVRVLPPTYRPTHIDYADPRGEFRVYDVRRELATPGRLDPATRAELRASLAQTAAVVG